MISTRPKARPLLEGMTAKTVVAKGTKKVAALEAKVAKAKLPNREAKLAPGKRKEVLVMTI